MAHVNAMARHRLI